MFILIATHVYINAYMCTHVQYTLFEQSITVTIIDDNRCPFELSIFFISFHELHCAQFHSVGNSASAVRILKGNLQSNNYCFISGFVYI